MPEKEKNADSSARAKKRHASWQDSAIPENVPAIRILDAGAVYFLDNLTPLTAPYSLAVPGDDSYVYLAADQKEVSVLERLHREAQTAVRCIFIKEISAA